VVQLSQRPRSKSFRESRPIHGTLSTSLVSDGQDAILRANGRPEHAGDTTAADAKTLDFSLLSEFSVGAAIEHVLCCSPSAQVGQFLAIEEERFLGSS
jgi:hypothetical protein